MRKENRKFGEIYPKQAYLYCPGFEVRKTKEMQIYII